ncbi:unnamed protein product [Urochloa decumbens]|uniref:Bet v I/Major latex protein domain-containing protein n=1 Tax=Urochloa decumbens TaxID=240449 RepID=A0ABC9D2L2_9POAL
MKGSLCHEFETGLTAADVWEAYGGLLVGNLIPKLLPEVFSKVELVEGDGGVGTILLVTFPPGTPGSETMEEKFIKVDNENYIKEALVTEGVDHEHANNPPAVSTSGLATIAEAVTKYIKEQKALERQV